MLHHAYACMYARCLLAVGYIASIGGECSMMMRPATTYGPDLDIISVMWYTTHTYIRTYVISSARACRCDSHHPFFSVATALFSFHPKTLSHHIKYLNTCIKQ